MEADVKLPRRKFLHLAAGAAAVPTTSRFACAQAYPARAVRIVSGFAAGGGNDVMARLIGQSLSDRLGQPFIIENRPGSAGNTATELVINSAADGYTLLAAATPNAVNASLYEGLVFNFIRDVAPIAAAMRVPNVVAVNPSFPAKTMPEFIAYAKSNPGKVNFGSGGSGTSVHMAAELFKMFAHQHGARALPRRGPRACRFTWRSYRCRVCNNVFVYGTDQGWTTTRVGSNDGRPLSCATGYSDNERVPARL
jgi:tripartite-type tricarboxylate transporter receptor subunit TctC